MIPRDRTEDATAYVLGALEEQERLAFELALNDSAELQREVAELREVAGMLALAVRPVAPPPTLRERIVSDARAVRPIAPRLADAQRRESPATSLRPVPMRASPSRWRFPDGFAWSALAASLILAAVMQNRYRERASAATALSRANSALRTDLASRDSLLGVLIGPDVESARLTAAVGSASGLMFWNRTAARVALVASNLPAVQKGRTWQLWGIAAGRPPVSLGTFNTSASGEGRIAAAVPPGLRIAIGAVTQEPAGGSPQPTTTPIVSGAFAERPR
ncbi:MAG: hypothetical protein MNPFHGCM_00875 [Gemmatimonadaceae bacterium]|nr:hypothetical protein [Gemmatimonadaceae bacterium]